MFESFVIMQYLEDKYGSLPSAVDLVPRSAEARAFAQLLVRLHDVYISSPNCTQPGFSHTQVRACLPACAWSHSPLAVAEGFSVAVALSPVLLSPSLVDAPFSAVSLHPQSSAESHVPPYDTLEGPLWGALR